MVEEEKGRIDEGKRIRIISLLLVLFPAVPA